MADITMCDDLDCPRFAKCLRVRSNPGLNQSWFAESPRNEHSDECDFFLPAAGA